MNILLAGQNSIIGSFLYKELKSENEIIGIGKGEFNSLNYIDLDLLNRDRVNEFVKENKHFDVLIFLVGLAHAKGKNQDYPVFKKVNYLTLFNILETLKCHNKLPAKIVFSSTISVYGEKINQNIYSEDDELLPNSPYAKTKILVEQYLLKNYKDISWILRFAPVYSEDFNLNIERRTLIKGKHYKVGDGQNKLSLLNIKNILFTIKEILNNNIPPNIYNLADNKFYSYIDLLTYSNANKTLNIPKIVFRLAYIFGKMTNNIFLQENSIKLLTDNIYSTERIEKHISLPYSLLSE